MNFLVPVPAQCGFFLLGRRAPPMAALGRQDVPERLPDPGGRRCFEVLPVETLRLFLLAGLEHGRVLKPKPLGFPDVGPGRRIFAPQIARIRKKMGMSNALGSSKHP
jgi:hypothetical protein